MAVLRKACAWLRFMRLRLRWVRHPDYATLHKGDALIDQAEEQHFLLRRPGRAPVSFTTERQAIEAEAREP